jgi:hypothetical protein
MAATNNATFTTKQVGQNESLEYRLFFGECLDVSAWANFVLAKDGAPVSPFHDIPLWVSKEQGIANMVIEIPKGTNPKLEISKDDQFNPIKQDVKVSVCSALHEINELIGMLRRMANSAMLLGSILSTTALSLKHGRTPALFTLTPTQRVNAEIPGILITHFVFI